MNYDSVNEIFEAGVRNMTCLFKDSGSYDEGSYSLAGADFISFNGETITGIYAYGNSYWGFNKDGNNLAVDNRDTRMRSLYREEGTLYNYYRFIKVRWEGWSHYNSSSEAYQLQYDLVFWNTGDISLHMIKIPTACYDGLFTITTDKAQEYVKPTKDAPDITFKYDSENVLYETVYEVTRLVYPFRLLISDKEGVLYTIETDTESGKDVLVTLEEKEISVSLFKEKGFQQMPKWENIKVLDTPKVYTWSEDRVFALQAVVTGTPPKQYIECAADLSADTVLGIKALNAEYTGEVTEQHSFDGIEFSEEIPMKDFLTMDLDMLYAGLTDARQITFRFWLEGDATLTAFIMNYRNGDDDDG